MTVSELVTESAVVTADGEGFCDALRFMYILMKKEIPHTNNFADLQDHCIQLGNDTLPRLPKVKNLNNRSEQRMAEMITAIRVAGLVILNSKDCLPPDSKLGFFLTLPGLPLRPC